MKKTITCIECPVGCTLELDIENCRVVKVSGNKCPKGHDYAIEEIESPKRVLTSTVLTENLPIILLPVRTDKAIPKAKLMDAMRELKPVRVKKRVRAGDVIVKNFMNLEVNLIATRSICD
ncbi:MAG: DUF1667 domain-containing protein [Candidatus Omnitrophica bacterium]|nr:DUF1667 domain-containing protein [Candidatus Omnitrophota bacterium]